MQHLLKCLSLFIFFSFSSNSSAATLGVKRSPYQVESISEFQAIMNQLKPYGEFAGKKVEVDVPVQKAMSRGQQMVEEAKARNRAILAQKNAEDKAKQNTKADKLGGNVLEQWKAEEKATLEQWKKEEKATLDQWKKEQEIFLGRLKVYKENTFEIPVKKQTIIEKKMKLEAIPDVHIVNQAFAIPVRDQLYRATCSAFAGLRAVEIILAQHGKTQDLSEQYFYWASKPTCQTAPCEQKGSWVNHALVFSQKNKNIDIPTEEKCSYEASAQEKNETQIPLKPECQSGVAKVTHFSEVKTLAEVVEKIQQDTPVIMAAKLSENFYKNQGLVTLAESSKVSDRKDGHSMGHAFIAVGVIELPVSLRPTEGNFCLVVANSWGKGWGAGGYSCLTENWLTKFRQPAAFAAVTQVEVR
jgi:C1A family cysteine protease